MLLPPVRVTLDFSDELSRCPAWQAIGAHLPLHEAKAIPAEGVVQGILFVAVHALVAFAQPLLFRTPTGIFFRCPDIGAAAGKPVGLQTHGLIGDGACQNDQVRPGQLVAVFLFNWPEQTASFIEADVNRPAINRCKALVASTAAIAFFCIITDWAYNLLTIYRSR